MVEELGKYIQIRLQNVFSLLVFQKFKVLKVLVSGSSETMWVER